MGRGRKGEEGRRGEGERGKGEGGGRGEGPGGKGGRGDEGGGNQPFLLFFQCFSSLPLFDSTLLQLSHLSSHILPLGMIWITSPRGHRTLDRSAPTKQGLESSVIT